MGPFIFKKSMLTFHCGWLGHLEAREWCDGVGDPGIDSNGAGEAPLLPPLDKPPGEPDVLSEENIEQTSLLFLSSHLAHQSHQGHH